MVTTVDYLQAQLSSYAQNLSYDTLPQGVIHATKARVIDALGALMAGFFGEACGIARNLAAAMPNPAGATVIGTRMKTAPDIAAFVNATTMRYAEMNDIYHWPGSCTSHPSDSLLPVLAVAEYTRASGREFITAVVLAYEISLRFSDVFHSPAFDNTNFICLSTALGAGKLLKLTQQQLSHSIAMAVVPNVILKQVRTGHLSMFKAAAAGQAGRAGVFSALLARAGMEGPSLPFVGKAGWYEHVAKEQLTLSALGDKDTPFKIPHSYIKIRMGAAFVISTILAAEKVAPLVNVNEIEQVIVEVYRFAQEVGAIGEHHWNPESRESADHSIPYVTAATLMEGTVTLRSYDDAHIWSPQFRSLMKKVEVRANDEYTRLYEQPPQEHHTRVTVVTRSGKHHVGETGGDQDDMARPKSEAQIAEKFRTLTEECLGVKRVNSILDQLWHLEDLADRGGDPSRFGFVKLARQQIPGRTGG